MWCRRQRLRKMRRWAGLHQWRVYLRRYRVHGLLHERRLPNVRPRDVRSRRRRVHQMCCDPGVQRARQMRLHARDLPQRMLRCERHLSDVSDVGGVRHRRRQVPGVRRGARLQRRAMCLQSHLGVYRVLQRQHLRHGPEQCDVWARRRDLPDVHHDPSL